MKKIKTMDFAFYRKNYAIALKRPAALYPTPKNLKFKIALWLDNRCPDACWANLVLWAIGTHSFFETFGKYGDWREQSCSEETGGWYFWKKASGGDINGITKRNIRRYTSEQYPITCNGI